MSGWIGINVIQVKEDRVRLLRPGGITVEMLEEICPVEIDQGVLHAVDANAKVASPGMKYRHYAPIAEVTIVESPLPAFKKYMESVAGDGVYAMVFDGEEEGMCVPTLPFGQSGHPETQAHTLFDLLRKCDDLGAKKCMFAHLTGMALDLLSTTGCYGQQLSVLSNWIVSRIDRRRLTTIFPMEAASY